MHLLAIVACLLSVIAEATIMYTEHMAVQYTTDGFVNLELLNFTTWYTTEIHIQVVGCDYGYYNIWLIYPPAEKTVEYELNPFHCVECQCENFDSVRMETFISA